MDFLKIRKKRTKSGVEIYPDFSVTRSEDLMIRGGAFYAVWNEKKGLWSTDEYDIVTLVDSALFEQKQQLENKVNGKVTVASMANFSSGAWARFKTYLSKLSDNYVELDRRVIFSNQEINKKTFATKSLSYPLGPSSIDSYAKLIGTLYSDEERQKLEWAIGSVISGDSRSIQKFIILYGDSGTGKSTILNIISNLFGDYTGVFDAKAITSNSQFAIESLRHNPLVAIQHDVDLSKISDNSKLNSIVSHEAIVMNVKNRSTYDMTINAMLFMGTNKPVKVTDARSGIIRRMIDVSPTGKLVSVLEYNILMNRIKYELGGIAFHCLEVYNKLGKAFYDGYRPVRMMYETDIIFNFISYHADMLEREKEISLKKIYSMYTVYCKDSNIPDVLPMYKFRDEIRPYFNLYSDTKEIDGKVLRSVYSGFNNGRLSKSSTVQNVEFTESLDLRIRTVSKLIGLFGDRKAQYADANGVISKPWDDVKTLLSSIDETKLHYFSPPDNIIVIDIDLKDENGNKELNRSIEAAKRFPPTYTELSRSGKGIHMYYNYLEDPKALSGEVEPGIEIRKPVGKSAIRRKLTYANDLDIATISNLPRKIEPVTRDMIKSERTLRKLLVRNMLKEIHPGTYPSVQFIKLILDEAFVSKLKYNVEDMRSDLFQFASKSTHHPKECLEIVSKMHFASEESDAKEASTELRQNSGKEDTRELVFFDIETLPNLFLVVLKFQSSKDHIVLVNPASEQIEELTKFKLVGFNNRKFDNHILYAALMGYSVKQIYELGNNIINDKTNTHFFPQAYDISYYDVYDGLSVKRSLKYLQLTNNLEHLELDIPFDEPVPDEMIEKVVRYCKNDVTTLQQIFEINVADYEARLILAKMSGLAVNCSTQQHAGQIIFGNDRNPQSEFNYEDLSDLFPGYTFQSQKSSYMEIEVGEGGYVYAKPGMYEDVEVWDVASMHPNSIIKLNLFGKYTEKYENLVKLRLAIKHGNLEKAKEILDGYGSGIEISEKNSKSLAYALKIPINIVYGLTMTKNGRFRDPRNVDNIVAKRGALFMIYLKDQLDKIGANVVHIKTDSVKLVKPSEEQVALVKNLGKEYGYTFELEAHYKKFCLVNNAVYIAQKELGDWDAVGAQFKHPYVFKSLFSKEKIVFEDLVELKSVTSPSVMYIEKKTGEEQQYNFVGKIGTFVPVKTDGGNLMRFKDGNYYHVTGTKGYSWLPSAVVKELRIEIDYTYYDSITENARKAIEKFGNFESFIRS